MQTPYLSYRQVTLNHIWTNLSCVKLPYTWTWHRLGQDQQQASVPSSFLVLGHHRQPVGRVTNRLQMRAVGSRYCQEWEHSGLALATIVREATFYTSEKLASLILWRWGSLTWLKLKLPWRVLTDPRLFIPFLAMKITFQNHDEYYTALPFTRKFLAWFTAGQCPRHHQPNRQHGNWLTRKFKDTFARDK